jgi:hypothetical protein
LARDESSLFPAFLSLQIEVELDDVTIENGSSPNIGVPVARDIQAVLFSLFLGLFLVGSLAWNIQNVDRKAFHAVLRQGRKLFARFAGVDMNEDAKFAVDVAYCDPCHPFLVFHLGFQILFYFVDRRGGFFLRPGLGAKREEEKESGEGPCSKANGKSMETLTKCLLHTESPSSWWEKSHLPAGLLSARGCIPYDIKDVFSR